MPRTTNPIRTTVSGLAVVALAVVAAACGSGSDASSASGETGASDRPTIVVTTNILGDVVATALGSTAEVEVVMPLGADPHDFAPSARQAETMENADLLVVNGAGFEEGMLDVIDNVADTGTPIFSFADHVDLLDSDGHHHHGAEDHDEDHDEDHGDEDHGDEHGDEDHGDEDHGDGESTGSDPHLWTDPTRLADALEALAPVVAELAGADSADVTASIEAYVAELESLDATIVDTLAPIPDDRRVLVTNHEVLGYFADRYGFEVVGAIVPSLTTNAEPSAADIEDLAGLIESEGISAVFGETTQSGRLAEALTDEVGGDVIVVELFSESLGGEGSGAETYLDLMTTNADLIAGALAP